VVIYRDGAPTLAGYFQNEPYFDMKSVEVYRGPQGTFVGKNAAGGAVFINTNDPELGHFRGSIEGGVANYNAWEGTGIVNIPVGDTTAIRLDYRHYERDDFYDSITGNFTGHPGQVDNNSYRLGLRWDPNSNFSSVLKVDYHDLDFGGNPTTVYGEKPLGNIVQNANFQYTDESLRAVLDLSYRFNGGVTLTSLSGYQDVDSVNNLDLNATLPTIYIFDSKANVKIYSEEINLISPDDQAFRWVFGLFWEKQDAELPPWQDGGFNFIGGPFTSLTYPWATSPWQNNEKDWAVFAHGRYKITPAVELEAGVRYGKYEKDQFTNWQLGDGATPPSVAWPGTTPGGEKQDMDEDSVDWQVAVDWSVTAEQYLYALVSRGHISGGINIFPPFIQYKEMEVINYETGWKATWADNQFETQFTAYYEQFNDYQANFAEVVGALNFPTNRNAETDSNLWGIEFSGQARFGAFQLDLGLAYLQSELGTFSDVQDPFLTPPNNIVNLSGAEIPFAPNFTGNIGIAYGIKMGNFTLTPRADVSHMSETQAALWTEPQVTLPERTLLNAQLTLEPDSGTWSAVLWGTNVTDKEYVGGIQNNATLYYAAPPGQYGLRFKYNF
jgi:iron complex outermembrane receptor protein